MSAGAVGGSGINNLILNEEQIREIRHNSAMIGNHMACLGVLITLSVFLVLLSTRRQRRTFLLALQIFAFAIVIVVEILLTVYMYKSNGNILANFVADGPQNLELNRIGVAIDALAAWAPWVADSVLIYRVDDIYTRRLHTRHWRRILPISPLLILLVARAALLSIATFYDWQASTNNWSNDQETREWVQIRIAEWVLQIAYCSYAFAMIMRQIIKLTRSSNLLRKNSNSMTRSRLRFLFEAVLMTFFIPLITQIGTLIALAIYYDNLNSSAANMVWGRFSQANYILSVIFCILATSWSTIRESASIVSSRRGKESSSENPMIRLKSKGTDSMDEEVGQGEVPINVTRGEKVPQDARVMPAPQPTLLDSMFRHDSPAAFEVNDDEDVEELRTTQYISSQQVEEGPRPQRHRYTSQSAMTSADSNRNRRSIAPFGLPLTRLLAPQSHQ